MFWIGVLICVGAGSLGLTYLLAHYAPQYGFFDVPNERSSHRSPIPRGGGLAILINFVVGLLVLYDNSHFDRNIFIAIILGVFPVAAVGLWDDRKSLPARARLVVQLIGIFWLLLYTLRGNPSLELPLGFFTLHGMFPVAAFLVLFLAWMTNLYNFMDGLDGLAGLEAVVAAGALSVMSWTNGDIFLFRVYSLLGVSALGFLILNWKPAKIFMGDCGSTFFGFMFGGLAVVGQIRGSVPLLCTTAIFAPFIADSTFTLFGRVIRGFRPYEPHRTFGFHRLRERNWSENRIAILYALVTLFWGLPAAYLIRSSPELQSFLILGCYTPLIFLAWYLKAGLENSADRVISQIKTPATRDHILDSGILTTSIEAELLRRKIDKPRSLELH